MKLHRPTPNIRRTRRAFTLIELMVVVLILAILAALVVPKFLDQQEGAKVAKAQSDLSEMSKMIEYFRLDAGRYPSTEEGLDILYENNSNMEGWKQYSQKPIPKDPWQHDYIYTYPGANGENSYTLASYGADGQPGGEGRNEDIYESL